MLIRECHEKEDSLNGKLASFATEKEAKISELRQKVRELESKLQSKNLEICELQTAIARYKKQGQKSIEIRHEINKEILALFEALPRELGFDDQIEVDMEEHPEAMVALLKTRRQALSDIFKIFYENLYQTPNKDTVRRIQNRIKDDFHQLSSGYQDTISKIQKAEKDLGKVLKRSASLETFLKETKGRYDSESKAGFLFRRVDSESDFQIKINELQRKNDSLMQENKVLREGGSKWEENYKKLFTNEKMAVVKSREENSLASQHLEKLPQILKPQRSYSETHLSTSQDFQVDLTNANRMVSTKFEQKTHFEGAQKEAAESITVAQNMHSFEAISDVEKRLKQLSLLTEDLNQKIERSHQSLVEKSESEKRPNLNRSDRVLSAFYGHQFFSVIKQIYDDNLATLQNSLQCREKECQYLREKLIVREGNEEIAQCYIDSMKRAVASAKENSRNIKNINEDLKRELRELKDKVLVKNAEREMSLFYCKKNGVANGNLIKRGKCLEVDTTGNRHRENGFGR